VGEKTSAFIVLRGVITMNEIEKNNENLQVKKLIYVGKSLNDELEKIILEKKIVTIQRLQNEYNMTSLFKEDLRAINQINYLVLDLSAFINSTNNDEILRNLDRLRGNYEFRIILIAQGFKKGNELLASCFNMGIYNLVTAQNDTQMYDQLKICLSDKGMTYAQASQYRIDILSNKQKNTEIIKTNYEKVKQDVSIGVLGITNHIGTTSWAINLLHFLSSLPNISACFIEANNHKDIKDLKDFSEINGMGIEHYPTTAEIKVDGMEMYYDISKIGEIVSQKYDFYIYDYGNTRELSELDIASFLNKDIKFIVMGSKPWEYKYISRTFNAIQLQETQDSVFLIYNFVRQEDRKGIKAQMGSLNVYFNEFQPEPFILHSKSYLEEILKRYLTNANYEEINKSKKKFIFFKRRTK